MDPYEAEFPLNETIIRYAKLAKDSAEPHIKLKEIILSKEYLGIESDHISSPKVRKRWKRPIELIEDKDRDNKRFGNCLELSALYKRMADTAGIDAKIMDVVINEIGESICHICVQSNNVVIDLLDNRINPGYKKIRPINDNMLVAAFYSNDGNTAAFYDGNLEDGKRLMKKALDISPNYYPALVGLADIHLRDFREKLKSGLYDRVILDECSELIMKAYSIEPDCFETNASYGDVLQHEYIITQKPETLAEAKQKYIRAKDLKPKNFRPYSQLILISLREGKDINNVAELINQNLRSDKTEKGAIEMTEFLISAGLEDFAKQIISQYRNIYPNSGFFRSFFA